MNKKSTFIKAFSIAITFSLFISTSPRVFAATPTTFTTAVFSDGTFAGTPTVTKQDDITSMGGNIYIGTQNGVGSKGEPSASGVTQSTVVEYDHTGKVISSWNITGKCDGLKADPANNRIIATVNEDANSSMYIITPLVNQAQHITFQAAAGQTLPAGGTDSISFQNGNMYISASAPVDSKGDGTGDFTTAALFKAVINADNTATLTPVIMDNSTATNAITGVAATLNMSDPDSNNIVPAESPKYAGQVVLDNQGDKQLIFMNNIGTPQQVNTMLPISNAIDDMAWATSTTGTLYVSDTSSNKVYAISVNVPVGTVFVSATDDKFVGILNLTSGQITPIVTGVTMTAPHGLLFVPGDPAATITTPATSTATTVKPATTTPATTVTKITTLPQTGSALDTTMLVIVGSLFIAGGLWITFKKKSRI